MKKIQLDKILFLICFWVLCTVFIITYDAAVRGFESEIEGGRYDYLRVLLTGIVTCTVGASLLGSLEVLFLGRLLRKQPFGRTLFFKTIIYLSFMISFVSIAVWVTISFEINQPLLSGTVIYAYLDYFFSPRIVLTIIYWSLACMAALFILQVSDKFGQGVLVSFLLGKYHQPKEESRIFMFMDLKSSTTYAESLGHLKYSQFIQDCFYDITDVITENDAKIYQYVGDEVVLSWDLKAGLANGHCIKTFFAYDSLIRAKRDYYQKNYGVVPEFKAGLHLGKVTVAEVGEIKKELAFHGDAINTTARIQDKCNQFRKRLLVSDAIKSKIEDQNLFEFTNLGDVTLKGKTQPVSLYEVDPH
jgi:adenylate cyclase